ncbi:MAG TPA: hypothetical protein VFF68_02745 [Anaerolineaceae bacterium]|nr:hypothetical protein [Anaerolineaceae bacterium]
MNTIVSRFVGTGAFFLLIFLTGFWLSRSGKPYSTALFSAHKLIALAAVAFLVVMIVRLNRSAPLQPAQIAAIAVTAVCLLATIITGGMANLPAPAIVRSIHHVTPFLSLLSTAVTLYLLFARSGPGLPVT